MRRQYKKSIRMLLAERNLTIGQAKQAYRATGRKIAAKGLQALLCGELDAYKGLDRSGFIAGVIKGLETPKAEQTEIVDLGDGVVKWYGSDLVRVGVKKNGNTGGLMLFIKPITR